jgi:hypothetical protein
MFKKAEPIIHIIIDFLLSLLSPSIPRTLTVFTMLYRHHVQIVDEACEPPKETSPETKARIVELFVQFILSVFLLESVVISLGRACWG